MESIKLVPENQIGVFSGTHGTDYETNVTLFTALSAALFFDEFEINTNVKPFVPLDDIYLKGSKNGEEIVYLVQLKHTRNSKKLADSMFIKGYNINSKPGNKANFDLCRYNNKYVELFETLGVDNINFIFYTNYELDVKSTLFLKNENMENAFVQYLNTSTKQQSFLLNRNNDKLMSLDLDDKFINNTCFLTNQQNVDDINNLTIKLLLKFNISEDLSPLIINNLLKYFNNISEETKNKPIINKPLTLRLLYFTCLYSRSIPILELSNINDNFLYAHPYLWEYLKNNKVIIKNKYIENIQNMIFMHDDLIQNQNVDQIYFNTLFNKKEFKLKKIVKEYYVQCCCGLLPFLIETRYYQEIIDIMNIFNSFKVIFIDNNNEKYVESTFNDVSSELCDEIFKIKIRPLNRNECLIEDILENRDDLKLMLENVNISDFLQICETREFKTKKEDVELERFVYKLKVETSLNNLICCNDTLVVLLKCNYTKFEIINYFKLNISQDYILFLNDDEVKEVAKILVINSDYYDKSYIDMNDLYHNELIKIAVNVHVLEIDQTGSLFWLVSFGGLKNIKFEKTTDNDILELESIPGLFEFNKLIIFSGIPGIGKSVAMNQLSTFISSDIYVLLIKLTEYQNILNDLKENINSSEVLKLFYKETNTFNLKIFELKFNQKNFCVIFDGYDEIAPNFVKTTNNLIKCILNEGIKVVFTSRSILQNDVENEFATKSYILKPFDIEEQTQYIEKYFLQHLNQDNYFIKNICADIVNKIANSLIGDEEFNSVPLHLKIICDLLLDLLKNNNFDVTNIKIDKLKIYETFIDTKINIFKEKTKNLNLDEEDIKEYHQNFGLKQIFPHFIDSSMQGLLNLPSQKLKRGSEKVGILLDDVDEIFIHRTIAEYFTASWLVDNCENNSLCRNLIFNEIFKKEYYSIYCCFNSLLYNETTSVYNKIISNSFNDITSDEINQKYYLNRNILHLVISNFDVNYKSNVIPANLEEFFKKFSFENNNFIAQKDYFQLTPFNYSEKLAQTNELIITIKVLKNNLFFNFNQYFSFLEFLNCKNIKISSSELKFENGFDLFLFTFNKFNLIKYNFIFLRESFDKENNVRLLDEYKIGFEWLIKLGETINNLHYKAMDINSVQLSNFLLEKYDINNFFINIIQNPLSYAFSNNLLHFIKIFMDNETVTKTNTKTINYILNQFIKDIIINNNEQLLFFLINNNYKLNELKIYNQFKKNPEILNIYQDLLMMEKKDNLGNTIIHLIILSKNNKKNFHSELHNTNLLNLLLYVIELQNNINRKNENGETPLHLAIQNNDLEIIKILIRFEANVNFKNPYLHCSINSNNLEITNLLLNNKVNIETVDNNGDTPLICAVKNKNLDLEVVKFLLESKANIETADNNDETPLILAVLSENLELVKLLLEIKANIEAVDNSGKTPLMFAVIFNYLEMVKFLLQNKANIEAVDNSGKTPLMFAVIFNYLEMVKFLLQNKANIEAVDNDGHTSLLWAVRNENLEIIKMLLFFCVNVNKANNHQSSPLSIAAEVNKETSITKLLLEKNADIEHVDLSGNTPLMCAIIGQNVQISKLLIQFGAKINVRNKKFKTPLHLAVEKNSLEIVKVLLENNAELNVVDESGETPLSLALENKNEEMVLLIQPN